MNNLQSLAIIFWCFIVVIARCFPHHLETLANSPEGGPRFPQKWPHFVDGLPTLNFFCAASRWLFFLPLTGFFRLSQFLLNYSSVSVEFIFVHTIKMWVLHVLLLCHISRPHQERPRGGIQNCKDINTTTPIQHIFTHPISSSMRRDFHFMKCFDGTIFKLSWSKCIKCDIAPSTPSSELIKNV